jgi:hypothetical protein
MTKLISKFLAFAFFLAVFTAAGAVAPANARTGHMQTAEDSRPPDAQAGFKPAGFGRAVARASSPDAPSDGESVGHDRELTFGRSNGIYLVPSCQQHKPLCDLLSY